MKVMMNRIWQWKEPVTDDNQEGEEPSFDFLLNKDELETVKVEYIDWIYCITFHPWLA